MSAFIDFLSQQTARSGPFSIEVTGDSAEELRSQHLLKQVDGIASVDLARSRAASEAQTARPVGLNCGGRSLPFAASEGLPGPNERSASPMEPHVLYPRRDSRKRESQSLAVEKENKMT